MDWKMETSRIWLRLTPVDEGQGPLWIGMDRIIYFQQVGETSKVVFGTGYGPVEILVRETDEQLLTALMEKIR